MQEIFDRKIEVHRAPVETGSEMDAHSRPRPIQRRTFSSGRLSQPSRPKDADAPEPIQVSFHGNSHYNAVINPKVPLPLKEIKTSYIREGRLRRSEQQATKREQQDNSHGEKQKRAFARVGKAESCLNPLDVAGHPCMPKRHQKPTAP